MRDTALRYIFIIVIYIFLPLTLEAAKKSLSIVEYGINDSSDPVENYRIMHRIHTDALNNDCMVDYSGLDSLEIEICEDAQPIPIPNGCDFKNLKLKVINRLKNFDLFVIKAKPRKIHVTSTEIDSGNFKNIPELEKGIKLIAVIDSTPWTEDRVGHDYPHYRRDIMVIKDGYTKDKPLQIYSDSVSRPFAQYVDIQKKHTTVSNITITRSNNSTFKTICFNVDFQYDLHFENISIITPESDLFGDQAIRVANSMNIEFKDIFIKGTYSQKDRWGYGIGLNNVRCAKFERIIADGKWGVFGNNNISNISIVDSDINRFDVHCYGKDVDIKNTTFRKLANAVSSFFGKILFDRCKFIDFKPIVIRDSYRINTKFDLMFNDCNIECTRTGYSIISTGNSISKNNLRPELELTDWPNLYMTNTSIRSHVPQSTLYLFYSTREDPINLNSKWNVIVKGLEINGFKNLSVCNNKVEGRDSSTVLIKDCDMTLYMEGTE